MQTPDPRYSGAEFHRTQTEEDRKEWNIAKARSRQSGPFTSDFN